MKERQREWRGAAQNDQSSEETGEAERQEGGLKGWTEVQQTDPMGAVTGRARVWLRKECVVFSGDPDPMYNSNPANLSSCILCLMWGQEEGSSSAGAPSILSSRIPGQTACFTLDSSNLLVPQQELDHRAQGETHS